MEKRASGDSETTDEEMPQLVVPEKWAMYQLKCGGQQREFYYRVWCRPSELEEAVARNVAHFNRYYGTRYRASEVSVVQESH
jgi:hypothetical protein